MAQLGQEIWTRYQVRLTKPLETTCPLTRLEQLEEIMVAALAQRLRIEQ